MLTAPFLLPGDIDAIAPFPGVVVVDYRSWRRGSEFWRLGLLAHEWVHHNQQRRDGWLRFMLRWFFRPEWQARYESAADRRQDQILKRLRQ